MKRLTVGFGVVVLLVLPGTASIHAAIIPYSVTDLGDLPGGENASHAFAVNSTGQVVGMSGMSETAGGSRAFLWQNGVMTDIGVLWDDQHSSTANDINDSGYVVGHSKHSYLYNSNSGSVIDIGTFGGAYANAISINNSNEVVGMSIYANGVTHAFRWSNGTMIDLDDPSSVSYGYAYGINDLGQIVGTKYPFGSQGFLWEDSQMTDLGDLFGGSGHTTPFVINNLGQVVGYSGLVGTTETHPFIWQNGEMEPIGSPSDPMPSGYARGINNLGEVVGVVADGPFIWDSVAGIRNLNDLLDDSGNGWVLTHAYDINDRGQIVGFGRNPDGFTHGFLLTPIPEPSTLIIWSLLGALTLTVGWWRRRRAA